MEILKNGKSSWVSTTKAPIVDKGGRIAGIVGISRDITLYKEAQETVRYQTYHDGLTGLPNRALFNDMLGVAVNQAINTQVSVAVFFIDLDRFKFVNDTIGHAMGDKVLQQASERIASLIEEPNSVARVGGDEFTILLSDMDSIDDAARLGSNIIEVLNNPFLLEGHEFFITCSIGISIYPFDGQDGPTLLKNADIAMYRAKEEGRNNYQLYNASMNVKVFERLALESNLRYALERNEFVVYYQPQVDASKKIVSMEALVRWNHPQMGIISPMSFIPLAEETGLIAYR
jgi:diguanylate cyclase (GGDEF)-like protein